MRIVTKLIQIHNFLKTKGSFPPYLIALYLWAGVCFHYKAGRGFPASLFITHCALDIQGRTAQKQYFNLKKVSKGLCKVYF